MVQTKAMDLIYIFYIMYIVCYRFVVSKIILTIISIVFEFKILILDIHQ